MFVNCRSGGWVIRIEPSRMTTVLVRCDSLLIVSICLASHGFAHPVKVDVPLVSFPLSGVRNDLASELRSAAWRRVVHCVVAHSVAGGHFGFATGLCVSIHRNCGEI